MDNALEELIYREIKFYKFLKSKKCSPVRNATFHFVCRKRYIEVIFVHPFCNEWISYFYLLQELKKM